MHASATATTPRLVSAKASIAHDASALKRVSRVAKVREDRSIDG